MNDSMEPLVLQNGQDESCNCTLAKHVGLTTFRVEVWLGFYF